jgi:hypothetical protein
VHSVFNIYIHSSFSCAGFQPAACVEGETVGTPGQCRPIISLALLKSYTQLKTLFLNEQNNSGEVASDLYFLLKGIIEVFVEEVGSKSPDKSSEIRYSYDSKPEMKGIKVRTSHFQS